MSVRAVQILNAFLEVQYYVMIFLLLFLAFRLLVLEPTVKQEMKRRV